MWNSNHLIHAQSQKRDGTALCHILSASTQRENLPVFDVLIEYGALDTPFQQRWEPYHTNWGSTASTYEEVAKANSKNKIYERLKKHTVNTRKAKQTGRLLPKSVLEGAIFRGCR